MRTEFVSSASNPKVQAFLSLREKSRDRREKGLFVVEGVREVERCLIGGYVPRTFFVCEEILPAQALEALCSDAERLNDGLLLVKVGVKVYEKLALRGGTEGIVAEFESKEISLEDLSLGENPLIVVLESVEKPGNLGAVLRSADAAGASALIVCDPLTDLWNPNLLRSSLGARFTVPTVACSSQDAIAWLKAKGIKILTAQLQDSKVYYDSPMDCPVAIVMGTESSGLSEAWRKASDAHIMIPMLGKVDSLNVSVSAAILLFEAVRQRLGGKI